MKRILLSVAVLVAALGVGAVPAHASTTYTAPSSIASDCSVDVTAQLNSWLASVPNGIPGTRNIASFRAGACYRMAGTLGTGPREAGTAGLNRQHLILEGNGATINNGLDVPPPTPYGTDQRAGIALQGGDHITVRNFNIRGAHNGTFTDPNSTTGAKYDYPCNVPDGDTATDCHTDAVRHKTGYYGERQWEAGVAIFGADHVRVLNNTIRDVFGDGVEFARGIGPGQLPATTYSEASGNTIDGVGRMGMSWTSNDNNTYAHNSIDRVSYAALDIEGEGSTLTNLDFSSNTMDRAWFYIAAANGNCIPHANWTFANNVMLRSTVNSGDPFGIGDGVGCPVATNLSVTGNTVQHLNASAGGWAKAAIQVAGWSGVTVTGNTITSSPKANQYGPVGMVRLRNTTGALVVSNNSEPQAGYAYGLDDVGNAPGVTACGNTDLAGPNQPAAC